MKRYTIINQAITLYSGILDHTPKQAASRSSSLNDLGEGLYEIAGSVQFKVGEQIGYDGEVTKAMQEKLECLKEPLVKKLLADQGKKNP